MNITNKTILVTGGGSGIGFEFAKSLSEKNNRVIITGRNEDKLRQAAAKLRNVTYFAADVNDAAQLDALVAHIQKEFGKLDVLVNNAGFTYVYSLAGATGVYEKAVEEFNTNFFAAIRLTEKALPLLSAQPEAAIVNVSSIVALVPVGSLPTYSASKAALHFYTQTLRHALAKTTGIKVFEIMPPLVNTDFSKEIGGSNGIAPSVVADDLLAGLESDRYEIHVGQTADIYKLLQAAPAEAFKALNG
jgi:uncharacterized oxidoreductase